MTRVEFIIAVHAVNNPIKRKRGLVAVGHTVRENACGGGKRGGQAISFV